MKTMILAAGKGERMRPLTDHTPKPLLLVGGKPLIAHHIERLVSQGFREIIINHAYLGEQIVDFIKDGAQFGADVFLSHEDEPLETGGGIFQALPALVTEAQRVFLLVNGDVWMPFDYAGLRIPQTSLCHLVMVPNPAHNPSGDFTLNEHGILGLKTDRDAHTYTFSGVSIVHADLFKACQSGKFPLAPLIKDAITQGKATGEIYQGTWVDVGTPERLAMVESLLCNASV